MECSNELTGYLLYQRPVPVTVIQSDLYASEPGGTPKIILVLTNIKLNMRFYTINVDVLLETSKKHTMGQR